MGVKKKYAVQTEVCVQQALMTIACSFINVYDNQYGLSHCGEKCKCAKFAGPRTYHDNTYNSECNK